MKSAFFAFLVLLQLNFKDNGLSETYSDTLKASVCGMEIGQIQTDQIISCGLSISDTLNYWVETFSISWNEGNDTIEMPVHQQIPDYYYDLIRSVQPGSTFNFNHIAVREKASGQLKFIPSLSFTIKASK